MSAPEPRTAAERITLVCSCLILAVVIGLIASQARSPRSPAAPVASVAQVRSVGGQHHVEVIVTNEGAQTAANVAVTAELVIGEATTTSEQTVDLLAGSEEVELTFVFEDDPASGTLSVVVAGFAAP